MKDRKAVKAAFGSAIKSQKKAAKKAKQASMVDVKAFINLGIKVGKPVSKAVGYDLLMAAK